MSTPTPRTDAFARTLETELNALTAERDQLRAIFPQICNALGNGAFCTPTVSFGLIESIPNEVQAVVAKLRAEVERLKRDYEYDHKCLHEVRERCESWKQRAEQAEAELAKAKERLRSEAMDDYASIKDLQRELAELKEGAK